MAKTKNEPVSMAFLVAALAIVAAVTWTYLRPVPSSEYVSGTVAARASTAPNWITYHTKDYKFSFRAPQDYKANISRPYALYGGIHPLQVVGLVSGATAYRDHFSVTVSPKTAAENIFNIRPFYQRAMSGNDLFYDAKKNIWVAWPGREPACKKTTPLGSGSVPAYRFSRSDAGYSSTDYVVILPNVLLDLEVNSGPIGIPDPNAEKILGSFELDSPSSAIKAMCV